MFCVLRLVCVFLYIHGFGVVRNTMLLGFCYKFYEFRVDSSSTLLLSPMPSPSPPRNPKSASPWLDRLRSSKGLPSVDAPTLDHFLANHLPPFLPDSLPSRRPPPDLPATQDPCLLPHILSDLFCIAPSSHLPRNKFPRKQPNPRSFSLPLPPAALHNNTSVGNTPIRILKDEVVPSSNSDNTTEGVEFKRTPHVGWGDVDEEENSDKELTGYSRSEVTVIDTSCDLWKSDWVVFRRRNVWKIRAKKGRLRSYGRKKRKQDTHDLIQGISVTASGNNNANAFSLQDLSCSNPEDACGNRLTKPSYVNSQNEDREEIGAVAAGVMDDAICTNSQDMQRHNPEKGSVLSGLDLKARKRGSIAIEGFST